MENRLIETDKVRLARVKYYDASKNGAELMDQEAYAFLVQVQDGQFVNPFDLEEELPVLDRTFYANIRTTGEEFGTKLFHVCGELKTGPCYVIERVSIHNLFKKPTITLDDLKNYILHSNLFFVDRRNIIKGLEESFLKKARFLPIYISDDAKMDQLKQFFLDHEVQVQYKK